jgi:hypothetical protein
VVAAAKGGGGGSGGGGGGGGGVSHNRGRGRGLHSPTFWLNLSRFRYKIHPEPPLKVPDTSQTSPRQPLSAPPIPQRALTLSRKVDECKPLGGGRPLDIFKRLEQTEWDTLIFFYGVIMCVGGLGRDMLRSLPGYLKLRSTRLEFETLSK